MATPGGVPQIQVFRPTWEEFKDFNNYIAYMESKGAHKAGLAKIIPPPEWKPCPNGYNMEAIGEMEIPAPISQVVQGKQGIYTLFNILKKPMKVKEFRKQAFSAKYATPHHDDYEDLDRKYWRNLSYNSPIYGADVSGSLTDPNVEEWNINKLGSILDYVNEDYKISIDGVNTAYLYFGMWKSSFAWHTEDMDLYSINYIHFGEPKSWYSVPTEYGARLERLANNNFQSFAKECPAFLRHKMTLLSPTILKNNSIPFNKIVQEAGEFMVTFPFGYHAGFNHGFNAAESTNFASPRWVEYGKRASHCYCRPDMVNINMETFVKRFQPDRYELWLAGKDYGCHPEIPQRQYYAPAPQFAPCLNEPTASGSADGDDDEQQPTKNKAKRHLIHDGNRLPAKLQHMEPPVVKMEEDGEMDDDLFEDDEERFEIMKDVLYKAGEIETDGLEQWVDANGLSTRKTPIKPKTGANSWMTDVNVSWSENDTVDEDDSQLSDNGTDSSEDVKPPVTANKIRPRLTATVHPPKPITAVAMPPRYLPPMRRTSLEKHKPSVSKIIVKPVIKTVTPPPAPVPIVVARPVTSFNNFRIPKKTATTTTTCHQSVQVKVEPQIPEDARHWTELENSASQALVNMATVFSSDNSNSSSIMTRIQKPSETCFIQHHSSSSYLSDSATRTIPHQLLQPESPSRRPRKQKMPRSRSINTVSAKSTSRTLLWSKQREWTLDREADFNLLSSQTSPFCSVCSLLASDQEENGPIPPSSAVSIPEELFKKESNGKWSRMNSSPLLRCSSCRVCVHARCYGLASDLPALSWLCRRCSRNEETAKCCLCLQRGGALKPTSDNRWAHILCALCFPGVKFADSSTLEPIQVGGCGAGGEQLNSATTLHSNCSFCSDQSDNRNVFYRGICVSCSDRRCQKTFHPTCALVNGVRFTLSGEGRLVSLCCSPGPLQSSSSSAKRKTSSVAPLGLVDISVGQLVYAKHPTGGHRLAAVTDNTDKVTYYRIKFADGSTSDDTYPEDITNYACKEDGPPPAGAAVTVKWTDGKIYHGYYKGSHQRVLYRLTFRDEDQTSVTAERTEFEPAVINDNDDRDSDDDGLDELIDDHYMRQSLPNES